MWRHILVFVINYDSRNAKMTKSSDNMTKNTAILSQIAKISPVICNCEINFNAHFI